MTKKRNKKYKAKPVVQNPINYFLSGLQRIDGDHLVNLNIKNHAAMFKLTTGIGERHDWDVMVGCSNMAIVLCEQHFDMQYHEMLISSRDALHKVGKRYLEMNKFIMTGDEMQAINNLLEVHEAQLNALRVIDVERAYDEVLRRINNRIGVKKIVDEV